MRPASINPYDWGELLYFYYLINRKKECPTCRVKVTSRRHLRPDPNFDGIIAAIYPNLDDFEAKEESMIEEINKSVMQSHAFKESIELGKRRQAYANKKVCSFTS